MKSAQRVSYETETVTVAEYKTFQSAFDFFNAELFDRSLPNVRVTLHRHSKFKGYSAPSRFLGRTDNENAVHELALNPDCFTDRSDEEILSTLVHEMCHLWQQTFGKPPRSGYHDRVWGNKMESIGLMPSSTGFEGGKKTGQKITHYIEPHGPYQASYAKLKTTGFQLKWESRPDGKERANKQKQNSKNTFTCPTCGVNVWGEADSLVICGVCYSANEETIVFMMPGIDVQVKMTGGIYKPTAADHADLIPGRGLVIDVGMKRVA